VIGAIRSTRLMRIAYIHFSHAMYMCLRLAHRVATLGWKAHICPCVCSRRTTSVPPACDVNGVCISGEGEFSSYTSLAVRTAYRLPGNTGGAAVAEGRAMAHAVASNAALAGYMPISRTGVTTGSHRTPNWLCHSLI
jgi:hypothetical protein